MTLDIASRSPEQLLQAFARTDYRVDFGAATLGVRIGQRQPALDERLGCRPWLIVTAFNPQGRPCDEADNRRRHRNLIEHAEQLEAIAVPAVNRDPDGRWPDEPSVLICDQAPAARSEMARRYDQAALVVGWPDEVARLEVYGNDWPERLPEWTSRGRR